MIALLQSLLEKDFRKRPFIHQVVRQHFHHFATKPLDLANLRILEEHQEHKRRSAVSTCATELQELASDEEDIIEALADSCESESESEDTLLQASHSSFRISSPKKQSVRQSLKSPFKVEAHIKVASTFYPTNLIQFPPPQPGKPPRDIAS